jgi:hypothetical protein
VDGVIAAREAPVRLTQAGLPVSEDTPVIGIDDVALAAAMEVD